MLNAELIMELRVEIGQPKPVGKTAKGTLIIIPITGGEFKGEKLSGKVCPGGADWNTRISDKLSHVFAKYWLETDDGAFISVENEGLIDFANSGVIKTNPRFQVDANGKYAFLESGVFVGELNVGGNMSEVNIKVYKMK